MLLRVLLSANVLVGIGFGTAHQPVQRVSWLSHHLPSKKHPIPPPPLPLPGFPLPVPVPAPIAHFLDAEGRLVDRSDQGVNNWWEHVKHDSGPSINQGVIHFFATTVDATNNWLNHPCPSGTDHPYTDRNGNTVHKCETAASGNAPQQQSSDDEPYNVDGQPVQLETVDGPKVFPIYCSKVPFEQTVEVFDIVANAWVQSFILPPDGCKALLLTPSDLGYGEAIMRFYLQRNHMVHTHYLKDGVEFTL